MDNLTEKQKAALDSLKAGPAILHVAKGYATKDATSGHGKLMASYRLVSA